MKILLSGFCGLKKEDLQGQDVTIIDDERIPLQKQGLNAADFDGVICNGLFLYNSLSDFANLKFIQLTSAGFDRVPLEEIKRRKIALFNAGGIYAVPMAEHALCGVLQLYKKTAIFDGQKRAKIWQKQRDITELCGKTVAIFGCGNVGKECAKRFSAMGCKITGLDVRRPESPFFDEYEDVAQKETVLKNSDIVISALPLTEKTEKFADENFFRSMKENSVFVNVSRGKTVDEKALEKALKEKLYGAVLDVFETEPLPETSPLWEFENVILTPHNSFVSENNISRLKALVNENLKGFSK